jgi:hypothetical protein
MLNEPNAGGSSLWSEVLSYEVLHYCLGASLIATEMVITVIFFLFFFSISFGFFFFFFFFFGQELEYDAGSKITDYSVQVDGIKYGVSVTRMVNQQTIRLEKKTKSLNATFWFFFSLQIDFEDLDKKHKIVFDRSSVVKLLHKKLHGILCSTEGVHDVFKWKKQILHIWATSTTVAEALYEEYNQFDPVLLANTLVIVTIVDHRTNWIF